MKSKHENNSLSVDAAVVSWGLLPEIGSALKGQQGIFKKMLMGLHHHHHDRHHHQGGALASASARSGHPLEKAKVRQVHVQMMMPMQTEALRSIASGIISDDD